MVLRTQRSKPVYDGEQIQIGGARDLYLGLPQSIILIRSPTESV